MEIRVRRRDEASLEAVSEANLFPVSVEKTVHSPALYSVPIFADFLWQVAAKGRLFVSSDADQNDVVTGQTSFANTTPTFLLNVPVGTTAIPLFVNMNQAGTVAGAAIDVFFEIDNIARYSSSGTAEKAFNVNSRNRLAAQCTLYTGATALAGYGIMLKHIFQLPQDVGPAVGEAYDWHQIEYRPPTPLFLHGPAAFLIYTYAGTTGPSWNWSIGWAEFLTKEL